MSPSLLLVLAALGSPDAPESRALGPQRERVLILPLKSQNVPKPTLAAMDDLLVVSVQGLGRFRVVTQTDIEAQLDRERLQDVLDCNSAACAVEIGGALGARHLLTGTVSRLGGEAIVTLSLIDAQTQETKRGQARVQDNESEYAEALERAMNELVSPHPVAPLSAEQAPKKRSPPQNLALKKPARQSSTDFDGYAVLAVDGIIDGDFFHRSVTSTGDERGPWWEVDLGSIRDIDSVHIYNRTDCCGERLDGFVLLVSEAPLPTGATPATGDAFTSFRANAGLRSTIAVGRKGRYVRIRLVGENYLSLTEVEVMGW